MSVTVRLFAMLREQAGTGAVELDAEPGQTAGSVARAAAERVGVEGMLDQMRIALAVNRTYADAATPVRDGDEVALIPPVSGGALEGEVLAEVSDEAISVDRLIGLVRDPRAGAIVTFLGEPRAVDSLDYEAYAEMAEPQMRALLEQVRIAHGLVRIAAVHRVGRVPLGEPSVVVAASAPHRPEAFAGARDAIDRIKAEAPIWKREMSGERGRWVEGS